MIDVFVSLRLCVFSSILNCCIFCLSVSCTLYMTSEVPGTAWICAASLTRSQQVNQLPVIPLEKTSLKGGHSRWPQPVWPNQMASGITVHLLGIFCCHPFRCHLYDSTRTGCEALRLGRSSSLIWRSLGIHGWSDWRLKEILKASHIKNNGPVVCNDAETQVTEEGSDENTANYSIKCAFVMSS